MLSDRRPILLANARVINPSRDLDIEGDVLIADGVVREAKRGISASGVPEGTAFLIEGTDEAPAGLLLNGEPQTVEVTPG